LSPETSLTNEDLEVDQKEHEHDTTGRVSTAAEELSATPTTNIEAKEDTVASFTAQEVVENEAVERRSPTVPTKTGPAADEALTSTTVAVESNSDESRSMTSPTYGDIRTDVYLPMTTSTTTNDGQGHSILVPTEARQSITVSSDLEVVGVETSVHMTETDSSHTTTTDGIGETNQSQNPPQTIPVWKPSDVETISKIITETISQVLPHLPGTNNSATSQGNRESATVDSAATSTGTEFDGHEEEVGLSGHLQENPRGINTGCSETAISSAPPFPLRNNLHSQQVSIEGPQRGNNEQPDHAKPVEETLARNRPAARMMERINTEITFTPSTNFHHGVRHVPSTNNTQSPSLATYVDAIQKMSTTSNSAYPSLAQAAQSALQLQQMQGSTMVVSPPTATHLKESESSPAQPSFKTSHLLSTTEISRQAYPTQVHR
jgi:hypothetical protein